MQKSSFFNSVNGDRKYNASDYAAYFGSFIGNGVYSNPGNNLAVMAVSGMNISVTPGKAWINGYYYENTDAFNMSIDPADGALKRIDRIVLRLDHLNRQIVLSVLKGSPAGTPTAPTLTRNADIYELGIADILINNGDTGVLQAQITDLRFNSALCGIVSGVVNQIDTTGLFAQYDAEFNDWFEQAQNTLSGDVAGNLLNQINTHLSENATTAAKGHVQLYNGTDSTSASMAATAASVKTVMDKANQAFQSANEGKIAVANAVTAKGVTASPADTFPALAAKIGQIYTGKKEASGTVTGPYEVTDYSFEVTGLNFTATFIVWHNITRNTYGIYSTATIAINVCFAASTVFGSHITGTIITSTGFDLNTGQTIFIRQGDTIEWYARE